MRFILRVLVTLFISLSCSNNELVPKKIGGTSYHVQSGSTQFVLTILPPWANFTETGNCKRDQTVRFLNLGKVMKSFSIPYEKAIELQLLLNTEFELATGTGQMQLPPSEEEIIFKKAFGAVDSGQRIFNAPEFDTINVVWVDPMLVNPAMTKRFKKYLNTVSMNKGHPVLLSLCKTRDYMEKWVQKNKMEDYPFVYIPSSMFSLWNSKGRKTNYYTLELKKLFKKKQKVFLILPDRHLKPRGLINYSKVKRFK